MGLTKGSVGGGARSSAGQKAPNNALVLKKRRPEDKVVALAGNPNVGKSTIFNALTGMRQHTGNWPGKTVANAQGYYSSQAHSYVLVDIPGAYSLLAHSAEEEVARDFLCFGQADVVVVVCNAACLERNLNLVLQTLEITGRVVVCVNLLDEAASRGLKLDLPRLSQLLGVPVVGTIASKPQTLEALKQAVDEVAAADERLPLQLPYPEELQAIVAQLAAELPEQPGREGKGAIWPSRRWLALQLLTDDAALHERILNQLGLTDEAQFAERLAAARQAAANAGLLPDQLADLLVGVLMHRAETLAAQVVSGGRNIYSCLDYKVDRVLTSRLGGYALMLLLLAVVFWLTLYGANYPSALLSNGLFWVQERLEVLLAWLGAPLWLQDMLTQGVWRTVSWVVAVMLPPMAIFFPLFTLLEDVGYLPRVAYNLDRPFRACRSCGKQALTMMMGFGCNAAGVIGCRIIDSPRERLLAILTNNFVPCNGRFPTLIALISMFFVGAAGGLGASWLAALLLVAVVLLGVGLTFGVTNLLSRTVLQGQASSFALELPSYRRPRILSVLVHSVFDRTLFVLGRAVMVAAPTGLLIWLLANLSWGDGSLLSWLAAALQPVAEVFGLDGVILLAFILGLPANEIIVPVMVMCYLQTGALTELASLPALRELFIANGWTWQTAVCVLLFMLLHWPCSTTLLTIKQETGSWRWTALAFALPTICGLGLCFVVSHLLALF